MRSKELWTFPVPSNCIYSGVKMTFANGDIILSFDFFNEENENKIYYGNIMFNTVVAHRHSSEKFTKSLLGAYDKLIEIETSEWLNGLIDIGKEWADHWKIKHYAIYLDSYGLYEFIARDFKIEEIKEGVLKGGI